MSRRKYNGGALVTRYKGVSDVETSLKGNQDYQNLKVKAKRDLGNSFKIEGEGSIDSEGKFRRGAGISYTKDLGKGFTFTLSAKKQTSSPTYFQARVAKPL
tara:strand:+ start:81 stop:383 length:303 start_codon:yes stop_codon:yes gene_type:complete